jgi:nucleoside-diphosphate-sugar epimerase
MLEHDWPVAGKPDRAVVIGAGGFVGAAVARALRRRRIEVAAVTRADVDLLSEDAAERLAMILRPSDAVVAAAAIAPVGTPRMLRDNIALVEALAAALAARPAAHLVNIGSDAVYADSVEPLTERACREPASLHGIMHLARETMLSEAAGETPFATLRPTLIYGADDPHNGYGPNRFRRLAAEGAEIVLFGEGEERRDHVWIGDVAELAARMVEHRSRGALNAATGEVVSFREVAEAVNGRFERPVPIRGSPRVGPMPHGGYRAFDPAATFEAFPDFSYTKPRDGFARVYAEMSGAA